jgi:catechol 2,3-dioxygenase-like lactoylglutathione lyase family enzyme
MTVPSPGRSLRVDLVTLVVDDYDRAIWWFTEVLGFALQQDEPATTTDGRAKRWVVVRPSSGATGFLLAQADSPLQRAAVGNQTGGRVSFFLHVPDFDERVAWMRSAGVRFEAEPRVEPYGRVVVFVDPYGNRWDLIGNLVSD